ncbi:DDE-type integrase/transposase/recombinase [Nocardia barduliensis]|uniref:DDE-type integrase/transposase/recombinase n=1 Tax=Nocardia barduliensis TaxID=2736643 RepID=UPI001572F312|nr:DDE-type integrase/transposase/recombinase [Nocardia barduliensis]
MIGRVGIVVACGRLGLPDALTAGLGGVLVSARDGRVHPDLLGGVAAGLPVVQDLSPRSWRGPNDETGRPNRLWVADATRIPCGQDAFWLAAVRDAFSNRIVGWNTSDRCDTELILGALEYAVWSRDLRDGGPVHHSDRGSTYPACRFSNRLADNGIAQ